MCIGYKLDAEIKQYTNYPLFSVTKHLHQMFGDLFYQRTDDETGLLYSSRRKFLGAAGKSTFEPPVEIQTRKHARRRHLQSLDNTLSVANYDDDASIDSASINADIPSALPGKKKDSVITGISLPTLAQPSKRFSLEENAAAKKFRKTAKFVMEAVLLESDVNMDEWREETAAGVHFWVNKETGEVVTECPWGKQPPKRFTFAGHSKPSFHRLLSKSELEEDDKPFGTGALVFKPGRDVDELFKLLDSVKL